MTTALLASAVAKRWLKVPLLLVSTVAFAQVVPPSIVSPPRDVVVPIGSTVSFTVSASGTEPLSYRWLFGNQQLGAASSVLTLNNVTGANAGNYSVIVSNVAGSVTSAPASLVVLPLLPGMLDPAFNIGVGADNVVRSVATDADGRIYVGGEFTTFNGEAHGHVARLNANGSVDSSFLAGTGTDYSVFALAVQTNHQVLIGGNFSQVNGVLRPYLARLNVDGTLDTTFTADIPAGSVWAIALQSNGKILVGGDFTTVGGSSLRRLARLNFDGTLDPDFNPGNGLNDSVRAIVVQPDGNILVAGAFTQVGASFFNRIARLTPLGDVDLSFNPGSGASYWVNAISLQPDGKVLIGGSFTSVGGAVRNYLARLNSNGTLDPNFNQTNGPNNAVTSMALQPDGKLIIGGGFSSVNQQPHLFFARLNNDAQIDDGFFFGAGANYWVESVRLQSDGKILIGGAFQTVNGESRSFMARLLGGNPSPFAPLLTQQPPAQQTYGEGNNVLLPAMAVAFPSPFYQWQFNGTNLPGATAATLVLDNVRLAQAGSYRLIASNSLGSVTSRVAVLNVTPARINPGAVDVNFYAGDGPNSAVLSLAVQPDNRVLVAGYFYSVDGVPRATVARLNPGGSLDLTFQPVVDYYVSQIAAVPSGGALIAGYFSTVNGINQQGIALIASNGILDTSFHPQFLYYPYVFSFVRQTNGQVIIGGSFIATNSDGLARTNLARLNGDGSVDPAFDAGRGPNGYVRSLASHPGNKVLVAGSFSGFNGVPRNNLVRLNSDGTVDASFNSGSGPNAAVDSLAVQPDGKILLAGTFRSYNGRPRHQIARLNNDGTLDTSFDPGDGPNAEVNTITLLANGKIMIGGGFATVSGEFRNHVARLNSDGSLDLTFDPGDGANDAVYSIAELPAGGVMLGGAFTYFDNLPRPFIVRLQGGTPPAFAPTIRRQPASQIVQAGEDVTFNVLASGLPEPRYQWKANGMDIPGATLWTLTLHNVRASNAANYAVVVSNALGMVASLPATLTVVAPSHEAGAPDIAFYIGAGPNDRVHAIALQNDGRIVIGGAFTEVDGIPLNHIARLNKSGGVDSTFNTGLGANDRVFALAIQPDGKIVAGGSFTNVNGALRNRVVRFETNGIVDASFNPLLGANAEVYAVALHTNGSVLIGGRFSDVSGTLRNGLARLQPNGAVDLSFTPGLNVGAIVNSLVAQPDAKVLVGGLFYIYADGQDRYRATRLNADGTHDMTFALIGVGGTVTSLGLQDDRQIMLGGEFFGVDGAQRVRVARLLTNGVVDVAFTNSAPNSVVNALQVQPDGKTVIGGAFTNLGAVSFVNEYGDLVTFANSARYRVARLGTNGMLDVEFNAGSGVQDGSSYVDEYGQLSELTTVLALAREPAGKILIGGDFTRVNGITRPYIARLFGREASEAVAVLKGQGMVQLFWDTGILQVANQVTGPWTDLADAESPLLYQTGEVQKFFRLKFN